VIAGELVILLHQACNMQVQYESLNTTEPTSIQYKRCDTLQSMRPAMYQETTCKPRESKTPNNQLGPHFCEDWTSDTYPQGCSDLQSLVTCLPSHLMVFQTIGHDYTNPCLTSFSAASKQLGTIDLAKGRRWRHEGLAARVI